MIFERDMLPVPKKRARAALKLIVAELKARGLCVVVRSAKQRSGDDELLVNKVNVDLRFSETWEGNFSRRARSDKLRMRYLTAKLGLYDQFNRKSRPEPKAGWAKSIKAICDDLAAHVAAVEARRAQTNAGEANLAQIRKAVKLPPTMRISYSRKQPDRIRVEVFARFDVAAATRVCRAIVAELPDEV